MSDIKSTISRAHPSRSAAAGSVSVQHKPSRPNIDLTTQAKQGGEKRSDRRASEPTLMSEFIAPPSETSEFLGNPAIGSVLAAVSGELAPDGTATSKRNQYVASVVETHLVARKQLAKHLNSLLRA